MKLHDLLRQTGITAMPDANPDILGICHDSRRVSPGDLYVAIRGVHFDGRDFAPQAVSRGAVAVLGRDDAPATVDAPWVAVDDPRAVLGPIAARLYGMPHEHLCLIGITGTNGKSTVTALVARILEAAEKPAGVIGTLGYHLGSSVFDHSLAGAGTRTTPEATDLFRMLDAMRRRGAEAVAMEVSSHALSMGRVAGARFDVAVFTNLTHDHLDFHGSFEAYFQAKASLFDILESDGKAVIHRDDDAGRRLIASLEGRAQVITYGTDGDVRLLDADLDLGGIRARIHTPRGELAVETSLLGRYNLENLLAAVAVAEALELPHRALVDGLAQQQPLPGRLEPVDAGQHFPVLTDYAHTPAALEATLKSLKELTDRKLLLVFGCGGDRDRDKRAAMGEVAGRLSDFAVVTTDNPRSESPHDILRAIEVGLKADGGAYRAILDRRDAIRRAVGLACRESSGWLLVVAGKGHEQVQIIGDRIEPFSDREELEMALRQCIDSTDWNVGDLLGETSDD